MAENTNSIFPSIPANTNVSGPDVEHAVHDHWPDAPNETPLPDFPLTVLKILSGVRLPKLVTIRELRLFELHPIAVL